MKIDIATVRVELHERALRLLCEGKHTEAARGIRRLLMLLPCDHFTRPDLLRVLAFAEAPAHEPIDTAVRQEQER